ncbi:MAG TPA: hypothetical protein VFW73_13370, partial [Lacipirellulaceae bacterium]|nr:hypothetical protein [Lacipirellulaceae bacterium]
MKGKFKNPLIHVAAALRRERLRGKVAGLVEWKRLPESDRGCTAIIGVCSKLPDVLLANLRFLNASKWPELKRVIAVVDCLPAPSWEKLAEEVTARFPDLNLEFLYYAPEQFAFAESVKLPYVYAWLSWCIALKHTRTSHVFFHDYDALLLDGSLGERYSNFVNSRSKVQGISWYQYNGVEIEDHVATTFEAFMDTAWLRSSPSVELFNKLRVIRGRSVDFDITLNLQYTTLCEGERTIMPMSLEQLVHPSQMIHQYTMFRRSPAAALPCFSIPMIPFFSWLAGCRDSLARATQVLRSGDRENLDLLGDGTRVNLPQLTIRQVTRLLK